jgi:hypothetical protein
MNKMLDFLYLDIERIKSLLSQLQKGVVESTIERISTSKEAKAGAMFFGVANLGGELGRQRTLEQEKSFRDYLYTLFDQIAEETGLFKSSFDFADAWAWRGEVRKTLKGGQLIKITSPTRIIDAVEIQQRITSILSLPVDVAGAVATEEDVQKYSRKQLDAMLEQRGSMMFGAKRVPLMMRSIGNLVDKIFAGQVVVRQFPCEDDSNCNLFGLLSRQPGLLQDASEAIFAKYGAGLSEWTMVAQIANVPDESEERDVSDMPDFMDGTRLDRNKFEEFTDRFLGFIQRTGFASAPRFPEISVTPLAVFHEIEYQGATSP